MGATALLEMINHIITISGEFDVKSDLSLFGTTFYSDRSNVNTHLTTCS